MTTYKMLTACFILFFFVASSPLSYASDSYTSDEEEPISPQRRTTSNYSPFSPGLKSPLEKCPLERAIKSQLNGSRIGCPHFSALFHIKKLLDEEPSKLDQNVPALSHSSSPLASSKNEDKSFTGMQSLFPNPSKDLNRSESSRLIPGQSEPMPMPYPLSLPQYFQKELDEIKVMQASIDGLLARTGPSPRI